MPDEPPKPTLLRFAELFQKHGVEFLVAGGQAEILHGSPRPTYDWDFCYRRSGENLERLAEALSEIHPKLRNAPPDLKVYFDARALALVENLTLDTDLGPLDLIGHVEPIGSYDDLVTAAESYELGGLTLRAISVDDLITIKEHILREKDLESLVQLRAIREYRQKRGWPYSK